MSTLTTTSIVGFPGASVAMRMVVLARPANSPAAAVKVTGSR
jgi:hypothetical protein